MFFFVIVQHLHTHPKSIPKWVDMAEEAGEKFPESVWKFSVYTVTWIWAGYLVVFGDHNYFFNLRSHWESK